MNFKAEVLALNPLGYWRLVNGDATDEKGLNNGTPTALAAGAAMVADSAGSSTFNGTTSKVFLGTPALLKPAQPMSVICWCKSSVTSDQRPIRWRDFGYWLQISDAGGNNQFSFVDSGVVTHSATWVNVGGDVADGNRHFLAGTYDGANVKFYMDGGAARATTATTAAINYSDSQLAIGVNGDDPTLWFNGLISDVAIFGSALTQAQIQTLYDARDVPVPADVIAFREDKSKLFGPF